MLARWGHTTPNLALAIYAAEVDRDDGEPERPRAPVEARDLSGIRAATGHEMPVGGTPQPEPRREAAVGPVKPALQR